MDQIGGGGGKEIDDDDDEIIKSREVGTLNAKLWTLLANEESLRRKPLKTPEIIPPSLKEVVEEYSTDFAQANRKFKSLVNKIDAHEKEKTNKKKRLEKMMEQKEQLERDIQDAWNRHRQHLKDKKSMERMDDNDNDAKRPKF
jgi:chromosome segregation ATPase